MDGLVLNLSGPLHGKFHLHLDVRYAVPSLYGHFVPADGRVLPLISLLNRLKLICQKIFTNLSRFMYANIQAPTVNVHAMTFAKTELKINQSICIITVNAVMLKAIII